LAGRVGERLAAFFFFALPGLMVLRRAIRHAWPSFMWKPRGTAHERRARGLIAKIVG